MIDSGWIKLYRQLTENEIWKIKPFSKGQAWIDLLVLTNHAPDVITAKNGQIIPLKRGECGWSEVALSKRWGWSRGKVFRFFKYLDGMKMVQQKIVANHSVLVICNYESFQGDTTNSTTNRATNGQQTEQQTDTNKNDKNDKNDKNIYQKENIKRKSFQKPSAEEVKGYCEERKNGIDPQTFLDFYDARGWMIGKNHMKDWKAAVRTWENKAREQGELFQCPQQRKPGF